MGKDGSGGALDQHAEALNDAFFQGEAEELRDRLDLALEEANARELIEEATGIDDPGVLSELAGLGIRVDTLAALTLIPLIEVAWADGEMDRRERRAILAAAAETGSEPGTTSYALLEIWTEEQPPPDLTHAWQLFIRALCKRLDEDQTRRLARNVLGRARDVAATAGNLLDRSPHVSAEEDECLDALADAFPEID